MNPPRNNWDSELNTSRLSKIEVLLRQQPSTTEQILIALDMSRPNLSKLMAVHRSNTHICGWLGLAPVWAWGAGCDEPRPPTSCSSFERADRIRNARGFKPQPARRHPMDVMLFGPAAG